jgi:hypothetical protein
MMTSFLGTFITELSEPEGGRHLLGARVPIRSAARCGSSRSDRPSIFIIEILEINRIQG